jgi:uncharacterized SAM-binding protein YcdF (DUF218 family)
MRRRVAWAALAALAVGALWLAGLIAFANAIPRSGAEDERTTDAIVVLTGGSGRLEEGATLLQNARASKLFVSGVPLGVDAARLLPGLSAEQIQCCVILGRVADTTTGNAEETRDWMRSMGYASLRLVTSNYHMPRSLTEFRHAMPGVAIVPHAVFPEAVRDEEWWRWPGTASLIASEYTKYLAAAVLRYFGRAALA